MRSVIVLTTGGTVATTSDAATGRTAPTLPPGELAALGSIDGVALEARPLQQVPSWALDPPAMLDIARAARDAAQEPGIDGVVVTHGTTTLEYTAFLTSLVATGEAQVVLTGAMRRADDPNPDGPRNLRDAVRVASSRPALPTGALVVFAGRILAARRVWKAHRNDPDAFIDLGGDVGSVIDGHADVRTRPPPDAGMPAALEPRVELLKATPGMDRRSIDRVMADRPRGIVIEGFPGAGGLPPALHEPVVEASRSCPVVVASRAPSGRVPRPPTGGTGEPLRDAALWSAGYLTAEQAWLLLMTTLGGGGTPAEVRHRFDAIAFQGEITDPLEVRGP